MMKGLRKALLGKLYIIVCLLLLGCMPENIEFSDEVHVEAVDLGLSVKWASCNVGATSPEEYGGLYAWGEIEEKIAYTESSYKWYKCDDYGQYRRTKYCDDIDYKTILDIEDDVAHVKWGGSWRIPTEDEFYELIIECDWEWISVNGVSGYKVTGPNGNNIFLPAAGYGYSYDQGCFIRNRVVGYYWSSTRHDISPLCLRFYQDSYDDKSNNCCHFSDRYFGQSVRPVYEDSFEAYTAPVAVDLGLSVKWASCNVGATSPGENGSYFAWGETEPKSSYTESNSITYGLSSSKLESRGIIDANGNLTSDYDAAVVNWSGNWRMPTREEMKELINNCTWTRTIQNGSYGWNVTGPNGNSIFLPTAGHHYGLSGMVTSVLSYWSATPYSYSDFAYGLDVYSYSYSFDRFPGDRCDGRVVRPVSDK